MANDPNGPYSWPWTSAPVTIWHGAQSQTFTASGAGNAPDAGHAGSALGPAACHRCPQKPVHPGEDFTSAQGTEVTCASRPSEGGPVRPRRRATALHWPKPALQLLMMR